MPAVCYVHLQGKVRLRQGVCMHTLFPQACQYAGCTSSLLYTVWYY